MMNKNYLYDDMFFRTFMPDEMIPAMPNNNFNMNNNINANTKFTSPMEGFKLGNLESKTYIPYKNYKVIDPVVLNERQKDLLKVQEMCFAAHELNLYLDDNPNDVNMINLFNNYNKKADELTRAFEMKYGPIELSDNTGLNTNPWAWNKGAWPWEK